MSTTARKARKRAGIQFVHPQKAVTPVADRSENQPRPIAGPAFAKPSRFGLTKRVAARLRAHGVESEASE